MADWWQSDRVVTEALPAAAAPAASGGGNWWDSHATISAPSIDIPKMPEAKPVETGGGLPDLPWPLNKLSLTGMAKEAIEGGRQLIDYSNASVDALRNPEATMEDRRAALGQAAEGAAKVAPFVTPGVPRGAGGMFAAPITGRAVPQILPQVEAAPTLVQQARDIGVNVPNFMAQEGMLPKRLAAGVKNIPGAGDPIYKAAQGVSEGLGNAARNVEQELGTGSPQVAGGVAKDMLSDWITKTSKGPVEDAYKSIDALINPEIRGPLTNTAAEVAKMEAERANAKIPGTSQAIKFVKNAVGGAAEAPANMPEWAVGILNKGGPAADRLRQSLINSGVIQNAPSGLNYQGIKTLRSYLGESTPQQLIAEGINPKEAKRLYGPLTRDMESIIQASGGEPAVNAWREANALARQTIQQRKELSKIIGAKGDAAPEAVFARLQGYAGSASSADINRLMLARKAIGPEGWNEVGSAMISRMGRDAQGNFSPDRFLTAWGKLSDAGKNSLFSGNQREALDKINNISAAFKEDITKFSNPSGTGHNVVGAGLIMEAVHNPLKVIGSVLGGRLLADALAKPAVAREIANYSRAYRNATLVPSNANSFIVKAAAGTLAQSIAKNIGGIDVKAVTDALHGAINATADQKKDISPERRNRQPDAYGINQQT